MATFFGIYKGIIFNRIRLINLTAQLNSAILINSSCFASMFASFLLLRLESMFFIEQIKKNYIYSRISKKCHAIFETKMCSNLMAATFMDFIKFGLDRKDLSQWPDNRLNDICVKNLTQSSKIFKIFPKELGNSVRMTSSTGYSVITNQCTMLLSSFVH